MAHNVRRVIRVMPFPRAKYAHSSRSLTNKMARDRSGVAADTLVLGVVCLCFCVVEFAHSEMD